MIKSYNPDFRKLNYDQTAKLVSWAKEEGWNPGPWDADIFWQTDPDGFYGYFHDNNLIAGGAIISYAGRFGFMGLFIVHPEYRSCGNGRKLWYERRDLLLGRLNKGASIGMDGVLDMQPFYLKGGFEIAFIDSRFECLGVKSHIHPRIFDINVKDYERIIQYDSRCFGISRPQFLIPWLNEASYKKFKYLENGELSGFVVLRKASTGYKIGPLFANNYHIANELYKACLNSVPDETVYLDIPMNNPKAVKLIKNYSGNLVFECARMYYGKPPIVDHKKIFGITTFELG